MRSRVRLILRQTIQSSELQPVIGITPGFGTAYVWLTVSLPTINKKELQMYNGIFDPNDRRCRRFPQSNVQAALFQQGDLVKYTGEKLKELGAKIGTVCARVGGEAHLIVVDFGDDQAYLLDERNLARTVAKVKSEDGEDEKKKQPEVQKRKGVSKRQKHAENNAE